MPVKTFTHAIAMVLTMGTATLAATPATASTVVERRFYADSGDACPMGATHGLLTWKSLSTKRTVAVDGSVVDRPTPDDPMACSEDGRVSIATFTAYAGNTAVGSAAYRADNGVQTFSTTFVSSTAIDAIVVQVCRPGSVPGPATLCGAPVKYVAPIVASG